MGSNINTSAKDRIYFYGKNGVCEYHCLKSRRGESCQKGWELFLWTKLFSVIHCYLREDYINFYNIVTCRPFLGNNSVQNTLPWKWIPGDRLGMECVSESADFQQRHFWSVKIQQMFPRIWTSSQHFPWLPLDCISGRADKNSDKNTYKRQTRPQTTDLSSCQRGHPTWTGQ
jgi:hypothetical protein